MPRGAERAEGSQPIKRQSEIVQCMDSQKHDESMHTESPEPSTHAAHQAEPVSTSKRRPTQTKNKTTSSIKSVGMFITSIRLTDENEAAKPSHHMRLWEKQNKPDSQL